MPSRATPGTGGATTTPRRAFPYEDLRQENSRRGKNEPEYELLDTGAFDEDRYWVVEVHYAKADALDVLMSVQVTNTGPEADTLHVLPSAWFRNTWSWDFDAPKPRAGRDRPCRRSASAILSSGELELLAARSRWGGGHTAFLRERDQRPPPLRRGDEPAVPQGRHQRPRGRGAVTVNPELRGTKCAFWYQVTVQPGATVELRLRLRPKGAGPDGAAALGRDFR